MTLHLHSELKALCALFCSGEISEEEWALLQIHMAYCDACHQMFLQHQRDSLPYDSELLGTVCEPRGA